MRTPVISETRRHGGAVRIDTRALVTASLLAIPERDGRPFVGYGGKR